VRETLQATSVQRQICICCSTPILSIFPEFNRTLFPVEIKKSFTILKVKQAEKAFLFIENTLPLTECSTPFVKSKMPETECLMLLTESKMPKTEGKMRKVKSNPPMTKKKPPLTECKRRFEENKKRELPCNC